MVTYCPTSSRSSRRHLGAAAAGPPQDAHDHEHAGRRRPRPGSAGSAGQATLQRRGRRVEGVLLGHGRRPQTRRISTMVLRLRPARLPSRKTSNTMTTAAPTLAPDDPGPLALDLALDPGLDGAEALLDVVAGDRSGGRSDVPGRSSPARLPVHIRRLDPAQRQRHDERRTRPGRSGTGRSTRRRRRCRRRTSCSRRSSPTTSSTMPIDSATAPTTPKPTQRPTPFRWPTVSWRAYLDQIDRGGDLRRRVARHRTLLRQHGRGS